MEKGKHKVRTVKDVNEMFSGKRILILEPHEYANNEGDFVCMVNKDGTVAGETDLPSVDLRMKVKCVFGEVTLESHNVFVIAKKILQRPQQN